MTKFLTSGGTHFLSLQDEGAPFSSKNPARCDHTCPKSFQITSLLYFKSMLIFCMWLGIYKYIYIIRNSSLRCTWIHIILWIDIIYYICYILYIILWIGIIHSWFIINMTPLISLIKFVKLAELRQQLLPATITIFATSFKIIFVILCYRQVKQTKSTIETLYRQLGIFRWSAPT